MDQILEQDAGGNREENLDQILEQAREYRLKTKVGAEQHAAEVEEPNVPQPNALRKKKGERKPV